VERENMRLSCKLAGRAALEIFREGGAVVDDQHEPNGHGRGEIRGSELEKGRESFNGLESDKVGLTAFCVVGILRLGGC
jgi:hypothetical protein